jgi:putative ABC transport system substrate-binding protein
MSEYAAELVNARVDVVLAAGPAIRVVQEATKAIPILGLSDDLLGPGLVSSMARPDGNTTGVGFLSDDLDGKRQELLIEAVPGVRQMAALADANRGSAKLDALKEAAGARNIELSIYRISSGQEIAAAIDSAKRSGAEALNVLASAMFFGFRQLIFERALSLRLPAIYQHPEMAKEGGFAAYGLLGFTSFEISTLDNSSSFCAALKWPMFRSNSRSNSS